MKTAFIGHRNLLPSDIAQRLKLAIGKEIALGCQSFIMGTHGDFDRAALSVCRGMQKIYPNLKIEVVIYSLAPRQSAAIYPQAVGVTTVMYEIENLHYKQRITASNRQMINDCDTLICYVRPKRWRSGADRVRQYAIKKGLKIINLYSSADDEKTITD